MKTKLLVLFLSLTVVAFGQTSSSTPATGDQSSTVAKCACCAKMSTANAKPCCHGKKAKSDMMACCNHDGKSCCGDAAQCTKPAANGSTASCCSGKARRGEKGQACCGEGMKTAKMECCGKQCGAHPADSTELRN